MWTLRHIAMLPPTPLFAMGVSKRGTARPDEPRKRAPGNPYGHPLSPTPRKPAPSITEPRARLRAGSAAVASGDSSLPGTQPRPQRCRLANPLSGPAAAGFQFDERGRDHSDRALDPRYQPSTAPRPETLRTLKP